MFSLQCTIRGFCSETGYSQHTCVDWASFFRDVAIEIMLEESEKIGGPGIYVEIDQSKISKRTQKQNHSKVTCNQNLIVNFMQFYLKTSKFTEKVSFRKKNLS